jgi:hypothetical protein
MVTFENKIPEEQPEQPEEQLEPTEKQETMEQAFNPEKYREVKKMVQNKFNCSEPQAHGFLSDLKEEGININDKNTVEKYLNKPDIQKIFDNFKSKWQSFHETP